MCEDTRTLVYPLHMPMRAWLASGVANVDGGSKGAALKEPIPDFVEKLSGCEKYRAARLARLVVIRAEWLVGCSVSRLSPRHPRCVEIRVRGERTMLERATKPGMSRIALALTGICASHSLVVAPAMRAERCSLMLLSGLSMRRLWPALRSRVTAPACKARCFNQECRAQPAWPTAPAIPASRGGTSPPESLPVCPPGRYGSRCRMRPYPVES